VAKEAAQTAANQAAQNEVRRTANTLSEQLALQEARGGAGQKIIDSLGDPRYKEMEKWQHVHTNPDNSKTVIHYVVDPKTGASTDFKFK
jgi:hypothetical protein